MDETHETKILLKGLSTPLLPAMLPVNVLLSAPRLRPNLEHETQ